jgi:radical SAM protein with 4Fe4S-binding SPASM domain
LGKSIPPPGYIQLYPTFRCNLSCGFCFNRGIAQTAEISIRDFERLIEKMRNAGIKELDILGGEPTLHSGFVSLLDIACRNDIRTTISSNGTNVSELENISRKFENSPVRVGISVNTGIVSPELHEYIVQYRPVIKSVCTRDLTFPQPVRRYLGSQDIGCFLLYMDVVRHEELPESQPFPQFLKRLNMLKQEYRNVNGVFCSGFIPDADTYPALSTVKCPAGTTKISVMPDGSVYPCYLFFRDEEFRLGNILEDDFAEIWDSPVLDFFRRFDGNTCPDTSCEICGQCHGGCPAVSYLLCGDLKVPDPRCVP